MGRGLLHVLPTFIDLFALVLLTGVTVSLVYVLPVRNTIAIQPVMRSLSRWAIFSMALSLLVSPLVLVQKTLEMSGQNLHNAITLLPVVLSDTHFGKIWLLGVCTLMLLMFIYGYYREHVGLHRFGSIACIGVATIAWTHSATGHAADGGDFTIKQSLDWLHTVAGAVWLGALTVFVFSIIPALRNSLQNNELLLKMLKRVSTLALLAFLTVLGTGAYNVKQHISTLSQLWQGHYGSILLVKLALVSAMLLLAGMNRFYHLPRLRTDTVLGIQGYVDSSAATAKTEINAGLLYSVRRTLILEALLGVGVLYLVALLIHEQPPM